MNNIGLLLEKWNNYLLHAKLAILRPEPEAKEAIEFIIQAFENSIQEYKKGEKVHEV